MIIRFTSLNRAQLVRSRLACDVPPTPRPCWQQRLYFASARTVTARLLDELVTHPGTESVRVELDQLGRIEYAGAMALSDAIDELADAEVKVIVAGTPPHARGLVDRVLPAPLRRSAGQSS